MSKKWTTRKSARLVRKAAKMMEDRGFVQGAIGSYDGGMCIRGAVNYTFCGKSNATQSGDYALQGEKNDFVNQLFKAASQPVKNPKRAFKKHRPITPIIHTLTDLRNFLKVSGVLPSDQDVGVEHFNDGNPREDVINWMHKFADAHDPQKV